MTRQVLALHRAAQRLAVRLELLESRLADDDPMAWGEYRQTAATLAALRAHLAPGRDGELLTTAQMAERLKVTTKTLLKRQARGDISPVLQEGKLIRWRGDEVPKRKPSTTT